MTSITITTTTATATIIPISTTITTTTTTTTTMALLWRCYGAQVAHIPLASGIYATCTDWLVVVVVVIINCITYFQWILKHGFLMIFKLHRTYKLRLIWLLLLVLLLGFRRIVWVNQWASQSVGQWISQWISESCSGRVGESVSQSVSQGFLFLAQANWKHADYYYYYHYYYYYLCNTTYA